MAKKIVPATAGTSTPVLSSNNIESLMRQHAGAGHENITADDLLIPRLTILQGLSPQVAQGRPEYDPDARVGQIYDVGMREGWPAISIVVAHYTRVWNEWLPPTVGKGIARQHTTNAIMSNARPGQDGKPTLQNGNTIAETAEFYVLNLTAGGRKSFIPMASTQLKEAKRLTTYMVNEEATGQDGRIYKPPFFYRTYELSAVPTSNAKGTWMLWKIERGPLLSELPDAEKLFSDVLGFREAIAGGKVRGDMSEGDSEPNLPWNDDPPRQRRNEGPL